MTITMATGLELLTTTAMAQADSLAPTLGVPSLRLMEMAGRAVAAEAIQMTPAGGRITVLCGPGNNGGDGFVAARRLREAGYAVDVRSFVDVATLTGDAAEMARLWTGAIETGHWDGGPPPGPHLVIDALFGAGLSRPLSAHYAEASRVTGRLRAAGTLVLAVDTPSGLHGDTGAPLGEDVFAADRTITFFRRKPGHLLMPGRALCGTVTLADIGLPSAVLETIVPRVWANQPPLWLARFPRVRSDGHKYTRGHAVVVSGGPESTGAARLGARGALRAGAGLVTVAGSPAATMINAVHLTAIMVRSVTGAKGLEALLSDARLNAVLIGPGAGVGADTVALLRVALSTKAALVLDADALTSFAGGDPDAATTRASIGFLGRSADAGAEPTDLFEAIRARTAPVVLTPHEGEFKRLFPALSGSKLARAQAAAQLSGAVVLLKGPDTVIAAPDGRAAINENAPPTLATAGSGDVLAGFITGLVAQGMPAFEAATAAAWLHAECGNVFGTGLIAEDIPAMLPRVLAGLLPA